MTRQLITLCTLVTLSISTVAFAGQSKIYKWTDNKGQVHYGSQPPAQVKAELIKKIGPVDPNETPAPPPIKAETQASSSSSTSASSDLKDKDRCSNAKQNLETLKTFARIKVKEENGEYRYLTPEEQQQKVKETELAIKQSCE